MTDTTPKAPNEKARIELPDGIRFVFHRDVGPCGWWYQLCQGLNAQGEEQEIQDSGFPPEVGYAILKALYTPPQTNGQAGDGELREKLVWRLVKIVRQASVSDMLPPLMQNHLLTNFRHALATPALADPIISASTLAQVASELQKGLKDEPYDRGYYNGVQDMWKAARKTPTAPSAISAPTPTEADEVFAESIGKLVSKSGPLGYGRLDIQKAATLIAIRCQAYHRERMAERADSSIRSVANSADLDVRDHG